MYRTACVLFFVTASLLTTPATAQPTPASPQGAGAGTDTVTVSGANAGAAPQRSRDRRLPHLAGHTFIPFSFVPDPFITTYVRNSTGFGQALDLEVPFNNLQGEQIATLKGNIAFLDLEIEYQHAVTDYLALRATASAIGRIGTNEQSVLAQGVTLVTGFEVGAKARLWHNPSTLLSASADFRQSGLTALTPLAFAQSVIDNQGLGESGSNDLISEDDAPRLRAGLRLAYSLRPWIGFTVLAESGIGNPFGEGKEADVVFKGGGTVSLDLGATTSVPLGVVLSVALDSFSDKGGDIARSLRIFGLGLAYTGRREFSLGLETSYLRLPQQQADVVTDALTIRLKTRYYF